MAMVSTSHFSRIVGTPLSVITALFLCPEAREIDKRVYTGGLIDLLLYFCMCSVFTLLSFLPNFHSPSPLDDDCSGLFMFFACVLLSRFCALLSVFLSFSSGRWQEWTVRRLQGLMCCWLVYMTDGEYFGFFCMVPRDVCWNVLPALVLIRTFHIWQ